MNNSLLLSARFAYGLISLICIVFILSILKGILIPLAFGGGKTELFEIDSIGQLLSTLAIPNAKNTDWEDLAHDDKGNIFIGDFGNNGNNRKDLTIYKIKEKHPEIQEIISFNFVDQKDFPPTKNELNFDCEAMFWAKDSLYLFSKNRGEKHTKLYCMPASSGDYSILSKAKVYLKANITAADINPSGNQFALLSYGKVFLFGVGDNGIDFSQPQFCIKTPLKQSEALTYITDNEILITNEQGEIYRINFRK